MGCGGQAAGGDRKRERDGEKGEREGKAGGRKGGREGEREREREKEREREREGERGGGSEVIDTACNMWWACMGVSVLIVDGAVSAPPPNYRVSFLTNPLSRSC